ncbi:MAG TPA: aminopeptidase P family protein [Patescibacteria group bacterium]|nr:aminopeptidase P family protein [Patescibacteria group bacterium]
MDYLHNLLNTSHLDALLISSVPNIIYLTGYSGFSKDEREAYLFITKTNKYLITDARYTEQVKDAVPTFQILERNQKNSSSKLLQKIITEEKIESIGFEGDNLTVAEYVTFKKVLPELKTVNLRTLREQKTRDEIQIIQKACAIGDAAFTFILKQIHESITEKELAYQLENFIREQGAELSFSTIVAFGANAAIPHHLTGDNKLKPNQFVLFDFGVKFENYCSDMSRTLFFGKPKAEEIKVYETVLTAQQKAVAFITNVIASEAKQSKFKRHAEFSSASSVIPAKAGIQRDKDWIPDRVRNDNIVNAADLDHIARQHIISQGYPSIPHSLGHGIGLEVHEAPSLSPNSIDELKEGMVFSLEPGIYLPAGRQGLNGKYGIRIEDLYTIQNGKLIQLTNSSKNFITI